MSHVGYLSLNPGSQFKLPASVDPGIWLMMVKVVGILPLKRKTWVEFPGFWLLPDQGCYGHLERNPVDGSSPPPPLPPISCLLLSLFLCISNNRFCKRSTNSLRAWKLCFVLLAPRTAQVNALSKCCKYLWHEETKLICSMNFSLIFPSLYL